LNRDNARAGVFLKTADFEAFLRVVGEAQAKDSVDQRPFFHADGEGVARPVSGTGEQRATDVAVESEI